MSSYLLLTTALLGCVANAFPTIQEREAAGIQSTNVAASDPNPWIAPGPNDLRAPCPGISTLANHGFINRDGRNITRQQLQQGFLDAFGFAFDVTDPGAVNTINLCTSQKGSTCTAFDLDTLWQPHAVEHDGSLTRADKGENSGTGDNHDFNATVFAKTQAIWNGATHITYTMSETTRLRRFEQQRAIDDAGWFQQNDGGSLTEHAFYQTTMADPATDKTNGNARADWLTYWWTNQRLPTALGWVKPGVINNAQLQVVFTSISKCSTLAPVTSTSTSTLSSSTSSSSSSTSAAMPTTTSTSTNMSSSSSSSGLPTATSTFTTSFIVTKSSSTSVSTSTSVITSTFTSTSVPTATATAMAVAKPVNAQPQLGFNPYTQVQSPPTFAGIGASVSSLIGSISSGIFGASGIGKKVSNLASQNLKGKMWKA